MRPPLASIVLCVAGWVGTAFAGAALAAAHPAEGAGFCPRPAPGSIVSEPADLRSVDGVLEVDLTLHNVPGPKGAARYCYTLEDGTQSPTLRLHPGDLLILRLRDALTDGSADAAPHADPHAQPAAHGGTAPQPSSPAEEPCLRGAMTSLSTNLHFHGLTLPPVCHQDEVLRTSLQPHDPPFEYRVRIPAHAPPGLYWYHPHIHGFTTAQVLGGASGAIIVEGLERAIPAVAGLPEQVLVIRDQDLLNPDAPPAKSEPVVPKMLIDRDGDSANNGTGFGRPAKDLSVNFVPVPYPDYPPAAIRMQPGARQLWRVLNAAAVTYLDLAVLYAGAPQPLGIVAIDGVPMHAEPPAAQVLWQEHIGLPPGARVEFIVSGPPAGVPALLVTRAVDTGRGGENDPNRALATIHADPDAPVPPSALPTAPPTPAAAANPWLGAVAPVRVRKLYFSEKLADPANPNSATAFYITVDGAQPAPFDPAAGVPDILVRQGDVEDWIIENRSTELHTFHIHQLHFLLLEWSGIPVEEPFLRDTVNVPYFNGRSLAYPSVRLRMDFRAPETVGTFPYHCHLLEHEDGGMMGLVRVEPLVRGSHP